MRYNIDNAFLAIQSCVILHNLSIRWGDILPNRDMFEDGPDGFDDDDDDDNVVNYDEVPRYLILCQFFWTPCIYM